MNKWWPCFYDMDTATGLSNTGEENVKKTAYIDIFKNAEVEEGVNYLKKEIELYPESRVFIERIIKLYEP